MPAITPEGCLTRPEPPIPVGMRAPVAECAARLARPCPRHPHRGGSRRSGGRARRSAAERGRRTAGRAGVPRLARGCPGLRRLGPRPGTASGTVDVGVVAGRSTDVVPARRSYDLLEDLGAVEAHAAELPAMIIVGRDGSIAEQAGEGRPPRIEGRAASMGSTGAAASEGSRRPSGRRCRSGPDRSGARSATRGSGPASIESITKVASDAVHTASSRSASVVPANRPGGAGRPPRSPSSRAPSSRMTRSPTRRDSRARTR